MILLRHKDREKKGLTLHSVTCKIAEIIPSMENVTAKHRSALPRKPKVHFKHYPKYLDFNDTNIIFK